MRYAECATDTTHDVRSQAVGLIGFLLGLGFGLLLLAWERTQSMRRIKMLLRSLRADDMVTSLSFTSQLSLAIAHQQDVQNQQAQDIDSYRQILQSAPVGYLHVDDENRLLWCNANARKLLGISSDPNAQEPRLLLELVRSYELDALIEDTRRSNQARQQDWTFYPVSLDPSHLSQQKPYALRGYGIPLRYGHVGIFLENRQETVALIQQRDRWASDVAHELKTPLTSIRLVAETLHSRVDPPLQGWLDRLIGEATRLSNLVQDLLDLSKMDLGSTACLHVTTQDLVALIHSAWISLEPLVRKKQISLDYVGPDQVFIEIDESRIYRVLINLFDNGIKYSPDSHSIHVKLTLNAVWPDGVAPDHPHICLDVIDEGSGFPTESLPHVFDRFYRADPSRSRPPIERQVSVLPDRVITTPSSVTTPRLNSPGTAADTQHRTSAGLGLAIVKQIVEVHGGAVFADNHPEWGGAWLRVYLPLQSRNGEDSP